MICPLILYRRKVLSPLRSKPRLTVGPARWYSWSKSENVLTSEAVDTGTVKTRQVSRYIWYILSGQPGSYPQSQTWSTSLWLQFWATADQSWSHSFGKDSLYYGEVFPILWGRIPYILGKDSLYYGEGFPILWGRIPYILEHEPFVVLEPVP